MSINTLHVTNGDSVLSLFRKAGILGTHVPWRDALYDGPVPPLPLEQLSALRADYLAARGYGNPIKLHREFEQRDEAMRSAATFDEVVLWFEHDLYDQLQLVQALDVLSRAGIASGRLALVQSDQYLGMLSPPELLALFPKRRMASDGVLATAAAAWSAFTAPNPRAFEEIAATDRVGLPFLRAAFSRLCEEFPGRDGLSRSQRQVLREAARAPARRDELLRSAQAQEEAEFLGDTSFAAVLKDLCGQPAPLLEERDDVYAATALGRSIADGDGDWLASRPLDRYIGGVHLTNATPWRYDAGVRRFVEV